MDRVRLYKKDAKGRMWVWTISGADGELLIESGIKRGSIKQKLVDVPLNKSGRNIHEQTRLALASRASKKCDAGYKDTEAEAEEATMNTNTMGFPRPMAAYSVKGRELPKRFFLQRKYDGNRCIIAKKDGKLYAYSRGGKVITSIDHILDAAKLIPEGTMLDGELYHHGTPLQTIRSWISRGQEDSKKLVYMCYDVLGEGSQGERFSRLSNLSLYYPIEIAKTLAITPLKLVERGLKDRLSDARKEGYEGLIIRHTDLMYEPGIRSTKMLKVKQFESDEFLIVGVEASSDGWAIFVCKSKNKKGSTFKVSAPGSLHERLVIMKNKEKYPGKWLTVEFANNTNAGIPSQPVAIAIREKGE